MLADQNQRNPRRRLGVFGELFRELKRVRRKGAATTPVLHREGPVAIHRIEIVNRTLLGLGGPKEVNWLYYGLTARECRGLLWAGRLRNVTPQQEADFLGEAIWRLRTTSRRMS